MFPLKKILLPIDFSERCLGGARYAIPLVEHFHSELTLLHVISPIDYLSPEVQTFNEDRRKKASKQLDDFLCAALNHLNTRRILREGDPAEVITDQAVQDRSDLIMMPTHGYSPFRRLLLGSTTSKVLHDTACPVWTGAHVAQGPPAEWIKLGHIVCAIDLGPHSSGVLRWAAGLAAEFKSKLTLLHVVPRLDSPGEGALFGRMATASACGHRRSDCESAARGGHTRGGCSGIRRRFQSCTRCRWPAECRFGGHWPRRRR